MYVGRSEIFDGLMDVWEEVRRGASQIVWIDGEPGMGRTATAHQFATAVGSANVRRITADEDEVGRPHGVFDQIMRRLGATAGDTQISVDRRVDRAITGRYPTDGAATPVAADDRGLSLLDSLTASSNPLVVVIDDLQWVDAPTLGALRFALRRLENDGVLVVLTSTPSPWLEIGDPWRRLLEDPESVLHWRLDGLGADELVDLALRSGYGALDPATAERLRRHTGGHPQYALALLDEVGVHGLAAVAQVLPSPRSVRDLTLARTERLGSMAREFTEAAAVYSMSFTPAEITRIIDVDQPIEVCEEVLGSGLVLRSMADTVAFAHPLVRGAIYNDLPLDRRRDLHLAAASVTQGTVSLLHRVAAVECFDDDLAVQLDEMADSLVGDVVQAADLLLAAAKIGSDPTASEWRLLGAAELLISGSHVARAAVLREQIESGRSTAWRELVLGQLDVFSGAFLPAAAHFKRALALPSLVNGRGPDGRSRRRINEPGDVHSRSLVGAAAVHWFAGEPDEALVMLDRALEGDVDWGASLAAYLWAMAMLHAGRGAELLADPTPVATDQADRRAIIGAVRFYRDDLTTAVADLNASIASRGGDRTGQLYPMAMALLAEAEMGLGRWDAAAVHAELAASFASDTGSLHALIEALTVQVELAAGRGSFDEARSVLAQLDTLADLTPAWSGRSRVEVARSTLAIWTGDIAMLGEAASRLSGERLRSALSGFGTWRWMVAIAEAHLADQRIAAAVEIVEDLAQQFDEDRDHCAWIDIVHLRARIAEGEGLLNVAEEMYSGAPEEVFHKRPLSAARLRAGHAALLVREDCFDAAARILDEVEAVATTLGAMPLLASCQALRIGFGDMSVSDIEDPGPLDLTPRQRSVVALVAEGLTNKEIAAELFVSEKTIEYHLGQVYTRHDLHSRRELVRLLRGQHG